jgi:hypothetical protein
MININRLLCMKTNCLALQAFKTTPQPSIVSRLARCYLRAGKIHVLANSVPEFVGSGLDAQSWWKARGSDEIYAFEPVYLIVRAGIVFGCCVSEAIAVNVKARD